MDAQILVIKGLNALHALHLVDSNGMFTGTFYVLLIVAGVVLVVDAVKHIRQEVK